MCSLQYTGTYINTYNGPLDSVEAGNFLSS
jgi:hypothetical protein